jgi:hypothetical protein
MFHVGSTFVPSRTIDGRFRGKYSSGERALHVWRGAQEITIGPIVAGIADDIYHFA